MAASRTMAACYCPSSMLKSHQSFARSTQWLQLSLPSCTARSQLSKAPPPVFPLSPGMLWLPESPRWLLLSGSGQDAAAAALRRSKGRVATSAAVQVGVSALGLIGSLSFISCAHCQAMECTLLLHHAGMSARQCHAAHAMLATLCRLRLTKSWTPWQQAPWLSPAAAHLVRSDFTSSHLAACLPCRCMGSLQLACAPGSSALAAFGVP